MVKKTELKPPAEIVEAIRASEDGSTAPDSADISSGPGGFSGDTPRAIRNALVHEEPQRPSEIDAQQAEGGAEGRGAASGAAQFRQASACGLNPNPHGWQLKQGKKYDRDHVTAGQQGRGAEAVHSKASIMHGNKQQTNKGARDKQPSC
ncbi:hypothetical protein Rsub_12411 [Raphidocelis subcapitata]|uniref:Uncharacterized protein n=1 Tax=Raphidocelis subcapitata TaxID=307507 RepID=A0A2V0PJH6_9CHLO|nr:hypothetical protein Rsub_12411 [Raphidocelis subcapitata]|eukprot:GBF99699.1 hypothetical protein Rsub_12411 [Raphidocelis subcapitata]